MKAAGARSSAKAGRSAKAKAKTKTKHPIFSVDVQTPARRSPRSVEVVVEGVPAPARATRLTRFCGKALATAGYSAWEIAVLLCGDARIQELNARYRDKPVATDVLSFPREDGRTGDPVCGDIAVSLDTLRRNAARFGSSENDEMKRLLVHGLLHLAGMDHGRGKSGKMLALQERLLRELNSDMIYGGGGTRT